MNNSDRSAPGKTRSLKERLAQVFNPTGVRREMLRYRPNKTSYLLAMLGLVCGIVAFATVYGYIIKVDILTGIDILVNILLMLFIFMAAGGMKAYHLKWSYASIGLGAIQIVRIFIYPTILHSRILDEAAGTRVLDSGRYTVVIAFLIAAAALLVVAGVIGLVRTKQLNLMLKEKGESVK